MSMRPVSVSLNGLAQTPIRAPRHRMHWDAGHAIIYRPSFVPRRTGQSPFGANRRALVASSETPPASSASHRSSSTWPGPRPPAKEKRGHSTFLLACAASLRAWLARLCGRKEKDILFFNWPPGVSARIGVGSRLARVAVRMLPALPPKSRMSLFLPSECSGKTGSEACPCVSVLSGPSRCDKVTNTNGPR